MVGGKSSRTNILGSSRSTFHFAPNEFKFDATIDPITEAENQTEEPS